MAAPTTYTVASMVSVYDNSSSVYLQTVIGPNDGGTYVNSPYFASYSGGTLTIDISSIASNYMIALSGESNPTTYSVAILYD